MIDSTPPPAIDPDSLDERTGSGYPAPFRDAVAGRGKRALGDPFGLSQFGVNLVRLPPGVMSSQRHWHSHEDEFVYVIAGELVLVTDSGETPMATGMCAGFKANSGDGHHLINRSTADALYLEVGTRREPDDPDEVVYSDIDMELRRFGDTHRFVRKSGEPW
jgi:uncharacterized cupin superfamily protein